MPRQTISAVISALTLALVAAPFAASPAAAEFNSEVRAHMRNHRGNPQDRELAMIRLQSLISQRQMAIQATRNMQNSLEQSRRDIQKNCARCF